MYINHKYEEGRLLEKLYELLSQDQFELLPPFNQGRIRLVYLMNDAVESFLVFEDAVLTGIYDPEYEGVDDAEVLEEDGRYVLIVHQGTTVCTIFFRKLSMEVQLFNYSKLGHIWMKGNEDLRQIEYWIAIMHDKREYLGNDCCNQLEKDLASLEAFPPLNCCSYPAVPRKYFEPRENIWEPQEDAIAIMKKLAEEAKDQKLVRILERYRKHHGHAMTRHIAELLRRNSHSKVIELLYHKIVEAAEDYPDRTFDKEEENLYSLLQKQAKKRRIKFQEEGKTLMEFSQVPFVAAKDDITFKVHLLVIEHGIMHRKIRAETISAE